MRVGCEGAVTSSLHPSMRADSSDLGQAPLGCVFMPFLPRAVPGSRCRETGWMPFSLHEHGRKARRALQ
jgi:hypothetical protein